jgi:hypothetical protein
MDKYIFNMDNEIDKSIKIILENSITPNVQQEGLGLDMFGFLNPKEKISNMSKDTISFLTEIISKIIINNPEMLQKITNSIVNNTEISIVPKK